MARTHQGIEFVSCHYATLKQEALLHLQGPDAAAFLQGQVTCDTRKLNPATAIPGVYCTVKGRVICDFLPAALARAPRRCCDPMDAALPTTTVPTDLNQRFIDMFWAEWQLQRGQQALQAIAIVDDNPTGQDLAP